MPCVTGFKSCPMRITSRNLGGPRAGEGLGLEHSCDGALALQGSGKTHLQPGPGLPKGHVAGVDSRRFPVPMTLYVLVPLLQNFFFVLSA